MRTGGLRSKLVADSLALMYGDVQKGYVCVDLRIVGFDAELESSLEL